MPDEALESLDREKRLDEAVTAFLEAQESGRRPHRQEWLDRYPEVAAELEKYFADQDEVDRLTSPLRAAIQGTQPPGDTPQPGQPNDASSPISPSALVTPPEGYELLQVLGQGGMGVVYKARQKGADRLVALKLIRADRLTSDADVQRFRNEAEAAAQLDHPHIVPVYEVGARTGHFFFSMKLIEGGGLDEQLDRFHDDPQKAARLVTQIARAVHHAHQRGILHRDLKPSNILLDREGQPHVSDFGLAKRIEADTSLTQTGAIVGTPQYMAPEQTRGQMGAVTTATDVYGLGCLLYALLTGRPPFHGETVLETLEQVREREPEPPRRINAKVDRDLETICLKCLEKEPEQRYGSAQALAEELESWLRGEPIQARRIGWWRRIWRWSRRKPFLAVLTSLLTGLALAFIAGLMVSIWLIAGQRDEIREQNLLIVERERDLRVHLYASDMKLAWQAWMQGELAGVHELLERHRPQPGKEDLRTFVWHYLRRLTCGIPLARTLEGHRGDVYSLAFAPDGRTLATAGQDGTTRLWDVSTGGQRLVLSGDGTEVNAVAFSPDGQTLATASDAGQVHLWDCATGHEQGTFRRHKGEVATVAFSPDGKTLASGGEDRVIRLWDRASLEEKAVLAGHQGRIEALAFAPDGKSLLSSGAREVSELGVIGHVIHWDLTTRKSFERINESGRVFALVHSHDGKLMTLGSSRSFLHLSEPLTSHWQHSWNAHIGTIQSVVFSPDDQLLTSAGEEGVRVWDVASRSLRQVVSSYGKRVWCVAFSPDGLTLALCGRDGLAKLHNVGVAPPRKACNPRSSRSQHMVALSPDGLTAASPQEDFSIRLWNVLTGELGPECVGHRDHIRAMCFCADGKALLTMSFDKTARIWDTATGKPLSPPLHHPDLVGPGALNSDGTLAVTICRGHARFWEVNTAKERIGVSQGTGVNLVAFSPEGRTLAVGENNTTVQLWDLQTKRFQHTLNVPSTITAFGFSPDGTLLAAGDEGGAIKLWNTQTGKELHTLVGHRHRIVCVAISPDGKTLASGGEDRVVKLWDVRTGQEVASLLAHSCGVRCLAFTPDGEKLISAGVGEGREEIYIRSAASADGDSPGT